MFRKYCRWVPLVELLTKANETFTFKDSLSRTKLRYSKNFHRMRYRRTKPQASKKRGFHIEHFSERFHPSAPDGAPEFPLCNSSLINNWRNEMQRPENLPLPPAISQTMEIQLDQSCITRGVRNSIVYGRKGVSASWSSFVLACSPRIANQISRLLTSTCVKVKERKRIRLFHSHNVRVQISCFFIYLLFLCKKGHGWGNCGRFGKKFEGISFSIFSLLRETHLL